MVGTTKVVFNCDSNIVRKIDELGRREPKQRRTEVINHLLAKALSADDELERYKIREEYLLLKLLHTMRFLASTRERALEQIDETFQSELPDLKEIIFFRIRPL